jgi:hypothetical protein
MDEETRFRAELSRSWEAVQAVAWHYRCLGFVVDIPDPRCRPSIESRNGYGDDFDIIVSSPIDRWQFEVKWRQIDFTCSADFPYKTMFVDRVEKIEKTFRMLAGYLMVNRGLTFCALIPSATRPLWRRRSMMDRVKGYRLDVFECPVGLAKFKQI